MFSDDSPIKKEFLMPPNEADLMNVYGRLATKHRGEAPRDMSQHWQGPQEDVG